MILSRRHVLAGIGATAAALALPEAASAVPVTSTEARKVIVYPSFMREESRRFAEENCWTYIHTMMERWDVSAGTIEFARVDSDRYREWMKEELPENGIPPHIVFGGAVVAGNGDPTFHPRWVERTRQKLISGELT